MTNFGLQARIYHLIVNTLQNPDNRNVKLFCLTSSGNKHNFDKHTY